MAYNEIKDSIEEIVEELPEGENVDTLVNESQDEVLKNK